MSVLLVPEMLKKGNREIVFKRNFFGCLTPYPLHETGHD